jgi:diguanylate cyclase (GGDEF)-like protein/PAS domain S-box-containing protein
MLDNIKNRLAPPHFVSDEKMSYRIRLINVMLNLAIGFMSLIVVGNLLDRNTPPRNFLIDFAFIGLCFFSRHLLFQGRVKLVGYFIMISSFFLMTFSIASEGTILAPITALFSILVIISGFIFNFRGIIVATIISSLIVAGLILAHQAGVLPPPIYAESIFQWFVFTCTFGMAGGLTYFYNRLTDQALERSKMEIEERERVEANLRILSMAVEQSPASVVITNLNGNIEYVNPRFSKTTGYSLKEAVGQNPRILKTDLTPKDTHKSLWNMLLAGKEWRGEFINRKKDGSQYYESAIISPITDREGHVTHYLAVKEDITERKAYEAELFASERRYRSLFEKSQDAVFVIGLDGQYLAANQQGLDMLGYTLTEFLNLTIKDTSSETDKTEEILKRLLTGEKIQTYERYFLRKDGQIVPTEVSIDLATDKDGKPLHIQSIVRDISERKKNEAALRESEAKYRIVADNTSDWEFWSDPSGKYVYISPYCKYISGYEPGELMADPELPRQLVYPDDRLLMDRHNQIANQQIKDSVDFRIIHKDGSIRWISHTCTPIFDEQAKYLGIRGNNRDITQRKLAEAALEQANNRLNVQLNLVNVLKDQLQEQAMHDPLTKLYNRHYLNESMPRELIRAERENTCIGVLIADIDHFKRINDTAGHQTGDEFLKAVANLFMNNARGSDIACRHGGEEFLLILPGATAETALKRAEEIRQKCEQISILYKGLHLQVTISIGLAIYPQHGKVMSELMTKADRAMYHSKHIGRNQVTIWDESLP